MRDLLALRLLESIARDLAGRSAMRSTMREIGMLAVEQRESIATLTAERDAARLQFDAATLQLELRVRASESPDWADERADDLMRLARNACCGHSSCVEAISARAEIADALRSGGKGAPSR